LAPHYPPSRRLPPTPVPQSAFTHAIGSCCCLDLRLGRPDKARTLRAITASALQHHSARQQPQRLHLDTCYYSGVSGPSRSLSLQRRTGFKHGPATSCEYFEAGVSTRLSTRLTTKAATVRRSRVSTGGTGLAIASTILTVPALPAVSAAPTLALPYCIN
jgi:hypothetical protein